MKDQLSSVLLVGGSSHMPAVRAAVSTALGREAKLADPDLAVAKGAALYAAGLAVRDIILPDHDSTENLPLPVESLTPLQEEKVREVVGGLLPEAALKLAERTVSNVLPKAVGIKLVDMSSPDWEQNPEEHAYVQHLVEAQTPVPHTSPAFKAGTVSANQDSSGSRFGNRPASRPGGMSRRIPCSSTATSATCARLTCPRTHPSTSFSTLIPRGWSR